MNLSCRGCSKALRNSEGIKCNKCESRFHVKCAEGTKDSYLESGDRKYHWICATCKRPTSKTSIQAEPTLLNAINLVTEKMEVINKIQLPKLNNDLMQVKIITDRLFKQNEEILQKIDSLKKLQRNNTTFSLQKRNLNISPRSPSSPRSPKLKGDHEQAPNSEEKFFTYRTRRRSYPLMKMLLQLNRNLTRTRVSKK